MRFAACLMLTACSSASAEEVTCRPLGGERQLCGSTSVTVPVVSTDQTPVVEARVGGKLVRLLLDTGAEKTTLSSTLLGVPDQVLMKAPEICIGKLCLRREEIYAWDTRFSSPDAGATNGFVGMSTLRDFDLTLEHGQAVTLAHGSAPCAGTVVDLGQTDYGSPTASITVGPLEQKDVVIDTGSTFSLLSQSTVAALDPAALAPKTSASLCTVNGCQDGVAFTAPLAHYCVGAECESDVTVKFPVFDAVGTSFLARRKVSFDFAGNQLWFCAD